MVGVAAIARRLAGRAGATIAFLFVALGLPAFQHFIPGRIDHHNVQIALAVLLVAATIWSDRQHFAATAAGILTGAPWRSASKARPMWCSPAPPWRCASSAIPTEPVRSVVMG
jgi:hypothetical protein